MSPADEATRHHFDAPEAVRDVVIGMSDGLTVPFALAAGLTGAIAQTRLIITAGMAEIAAGSIAMGLGGYLAARSDAEHYFSELRREYREVAVVPDKEAHEVVDVFFKHTASPTVESAPVIASFRKHPGRMGALHDALRARARGAASEPRAAERGDDRGVVRGRRERFRSRHTSRRPTCRPRCTGRSASR